jgi:hypothetical protein
VSVETLADRLLATKLGDQEADDDEPSPVRGKRGSGRTVAFTAHVVVQADGTITIKPSGGGTG